MIERDGTFQGAGDESMFYRCWLPEVDPKAVIAIVHGAAEHCGRYDIFGKHFAASGYAVVGYDHPCHGQSAGRHGTMVSLDDYVDTLACFQSLLAEQFPGKPLVIVGHSMGGLVATNYLVDHQAHFAACVLSGPAIKSDLQPGFLQMLLIRFLSRFFPNAGVLQLDAKGVSRIPEEVTRYETDPLVYRGKMSARMVSELFRGMAAIQDRAAELTLPMLMLHGGADAMASPSGSVFLNDNVSSQDKTLRIYPGLFHEIFNEPERDKIFAEVLAWINARVN